MSETKPLVLADELEAAVQKFIEAKGAVGLGVGVVCRGESVVHGTGELRQGEAAAPDGDSVFEIGSITKVLTTTLLADMHLRGEVDLDDPASKYLPSNLVLRSSSGTDITLRHLATHRSGLPRLPTNIGAGKLFSDNPYASYSVADMYEGLSKDQLLTEPGEFYSYSNLGMGLLGHILSLAADQDYEALVIERICRPLGMDDTVMLLDETLQGRLAPGHAKGREVSNWDIPVLAGCGAFRSTPRDMVAFLEANMHPDESPLFEVIKLAQEIQPRPEKKGRKIPWRTAIPRGFGLWIHAGLVTYAGLTLAQGQLRVPILIAVLIALLAAAKILLRYLPMPNMGLGWHIASFGEREVESGGDGQVFWHNGGTGGYRSFLGFVQGKDVGVVLLANSTESPDATGQRLLQRLLEHTQS